MVNKFNIEEVLTHDSIEFRQGYEILRKSIPLAELSPLATFAKTLEDKNNGGLGKDNYHFLNCKTQGRITGAATGYYIAEINMGFINAIVLLNYFDEDARAAGQQHPDGYLGEVALTNPWLKIQPYKGLIKSIDRTKVIEIVRAVYRSLYDIEKPEENAFFRKMLSSI